jgi:endogenous inhibitor of DNA gyrase (YacG/DUF329 family)
MRCYLRARWGEPVSLVCRHCGQPIGGKKSRTRQFCSPACRIAWRRGRPLPARSRQVSRICDWCGKTVTRPTSDFHGRKAFCDYRCMGEWQSANVIGRKHSRWRGYPAQTNHYGPGWKRARRIALARAAGRCERCKRRPPRHVHHRIPVRCFARPQDAHFESNLLAVCHRCHGAEHHDQRTTLPLLELFVATHVNGPKGRAI